MTRVTIEQADKRIRRDWNIGKILACAVVLPAVALLAGSYALEAAADGFIGGGCDLNKDLCWGLGPGGPPPLSPTASPKNLGEDEDDDPCDCEGNPIKTTTGNKFQAETDFVGGAATHLTLRRFYNSQGIAALIYNNSQAIAATAFGINWQDTWHRSLGFSMDGKTIAVTRADGRVDTFTQNTSGAWVADPDVTSRLATVTGGWQLTTGRDDSVESYDASGLLTSITTRAGLKTTLSYNDSQLATVTGPFGHTLSFAYDPYGRVSQVTAPDGGIYSYQYDANTNLASVTYPDGTTRQYLYENFVLSNALTGIVDEHGNRFATFAYDAQGRAISTEHAGGVENVMISYNSDGSAHVTDARGNTHAYGFTTQFNFIKPTALSGAPVATVGGKAFTYDPNGFLASRTDFNGNVTTTTHDTRGDITSITEAAGTPQARTTTISWHTSLHLPTKITEANGRVTDLTYDDHGNLLTRAVTADGQTRGYGYTYNDKGQVLTATDPLNHTTRYAYDDHGDLASVTNALGQVTRITSYDGAGRPLTFADPNGLTTTLTWTPRGQLASRQEGAELTRYDYDPAGMLAKITRPDGSFLAYTYDAAHRLMRVADALGSYIDYTRDNASNVTEAQVFDPNGTLTQQQSYAYDEVNRLSQVIGAYGQTTTYGRDANGNIISVTDPNGNTAHYAYDPLNRLIQATNPLGGVTQYTYDLASYVTSVTDPRGLPTYYTPNGFGNVTMLRSPDSGVTTYSFDLAGNEITRTDARGITATSAYDSLNRLVSINYSDGTPTITYTYDQGANGVGRLTGMSDPSGSTSWTYDPHGHETRKVQVASGISIAGVPWSTTLTNRASYDAATGRKLSFTYPSGKVFTYGYDADGRVAEIDLNGAPLAENITYQPSGAVKAWTLGGAQIEREHDLDGRVVSYSMPDRVIGLGYDQNGNVTQINDPLAPQTLGYDATDQLTSWQKGSLTQSYGYDLNGNRVRMTVTNGGNTTETLYNYRATSNQLTNRVGGATYGYDADGNITWYGTNFYYDGRGALVKAVTPANSVSLNGISGLRQRTYKRGTANVPEGALIYAYDPDGHLIGTHNQFGYPRAQGEMVWLGDVPVASIQNGGQTYAVYSDQIGTPRALQASDNTVAWTLAFEPFENTQPTAASGVVLDYRGPGRIYDPDTSLTHNGHRDIYAPMGRFNQPDPMGLAAGDVNTYRLVGNNQARWVDPTGLSPDYKGAGELWGFVGEVHEDLERAINRLQTILDAELAIRDPNNVGHQLDTLEDVAKQVPCPGLSDGTKAARKLLEQNKESQSALLNNSMPYTLSDPRVDNIINGGNDPGITSQAGAPQAPSPH